MLALMRWHRPSALMPFDDKGIAGSQSLFRKGQSMEEVLQRLVGHPEVF